MTGALRLAGIAFRQCCAQDTSEAIGHWAPLLYRPMASPAVLYAIDVVAAVVICRMEIAGSCVRNLLAVNSVDSGEAIVRGLGGVGHAFAGEGDAVVDVETVRHRSSSSLGHQCSQHDGAARRVRTSALPDDALHRIVVTAKNH